MEICVLIVSDERNLTDFDFATAIYLGEALKMNGSNAVASMVKENTRIVQEQIEFSNKYEALTKQYEEQKNSLDKAAKEKAYKTGKATKMRAYLEAMKQADDCIEEWSEEAWILMVERATVNKDKTITFKFVNSKEIQF